MDKPVHAEVQAIEPKPVTKAWHKKLAFVLGLTATASGAFATSTVTVPTITFPTGFDIPAMLTEIVTNNAAFILGGVAVTAMLYIIAKAVSGIRGGAGRIAHGGG